MPASLGPQDYVIVTLKAHSVPAAVPAIRPLLGPETTIVSGVNGIPWWYFYGVEGPLANTRLASVDPGDAQWNGFGPERMLGCVVYPAAEVIAPGVIRHVEGNRFSLGEPSGGKSARAVRLSAALEAAGLRAPVRPRIRDEIWVKLWGNLSFNPISALTLATLDVLCADPGTRKVARDMMLEAQAIAEALGVRFPIDVDRRIDGGAAVGRAPDVDAAGPRGGTADGDRRAGGVGAGTGPADRPADPHDRHGAGARAAAGADGGALRTLRTLCTRAQSDKYLILLYYTSDFNLMFMDRTPAQRRSPRRTGARMSRGRDRPSVAWRSASINTSGGIPLTFQGHLDLVRCNMAGFPSLEPTWSRSVRAAAKTFAALSALLALANCTQATEPAVSRAATSPSAEAVRTISENEQACLAEAIYFEAAGSAESRVAVAHVILNRAEDPRFPKTVCGVVRDGCQFSYRCSGQSLALKDPTKRSGALRTAEAVLKGAPDPTRGALFFHSAAAAPGWFNSRPRIGEIGGNVFYR